MIKAPDGGQEAVLLVTGANGLIGRALCREVCSRRIRLISLHRSAREPSISYGRNIESDLIHMSPPEIFSLLDATQPTVVVHLAGSSSLEDTDADKQSARTLHVTWTSYAMEWCSQHDVPLVYPSSIAVFDGSQQEPYREDDVRNPISFYGRLKAEAEDLLSQYENALVFRAAAVFGVSRRKDGCFPEQVLRGIPEGKTFRLFTDVPFAPIDSQSLAIALLDLIESGKTGLFHIAGSQVCSRWEFGERLVSLAGLDPGAIFPGLLEDAQFSPPRPKNQVLDSGGVEAALGKPMPSLDNAISSFLDDFRHSGQSAQIERETRLDVSTRSTCLACGSGRLDLLIDYGQMPLAGGFIQPDETHLDAAYPLRLARCSECTLMQILDVVAKQVIFDRYSYSSSTTRTLSEHFARLGENLVHVGNAVGKLVVEFGCNDGVLMRPLLEAGAIAVGVDPSDVAAAASKEQGWTLFKDYFDESIAAKIRSEHGSATIVTGNNVFAHTETLHEILDGVTTLLDDDGLFVFEVHYQGDLINLIQFDTVYHEHICYHSLTSLERLLAAHELKITDVQRIAIHAGSIHVTAARTNSTRVVSPTVGRMIGEELNWNIERFVRQVASRRETISGLVEDLNRAGRRVTAYGAAGRATILLNYCHLDSDLVEYVSDMSPLRYGKLVPGVKIPIVPPNVFSAAPSDYALMTAWNYEKEIVEKEQCFLASGGRFIVPLPDIRVVSD